MLRIAPKAYSLWKQTLIASVVLASLAIGQSCKADCTPTSIPGICLPNAPIHNPLDDLRRPLTEVGAAVSGDVLAGWIMASRNSSISVSQPLTPQMRGAVAGFIPDYVIDRARFEVGDNGFFNTANVIMKNEPNVAAVTLDDLIVFRDWSTANDTTILVHELIHVQQYAEWGVQNFAVSYARNYNDVEGPAYASHDQYWRWWCGNFNYPPVCYSWGFAPTGPTIR